MTSFTVRTGIPVVRPLVALLAIPYFAVLLTASATRDTQPGGWWLGSAPAPDPHRKLITRGEIS